MKKIIDKIKANKKLCKGLKIFKLVLDCLTYGFAIFMIIGLFIGQSNYYNESKAQNRELIPSEVVTPTKQAYLTKDYQLYSMGDFQSTMYLEGFFNEYQKVYSEGEYSEYASLTDWAYVSTNSSWTYYFIDSQTHPRPLFYCVGWGALDYSTLKTYNNTNYLVIGVKFTNTAIANYQRDNGNKLKIVTIKTEFITANGVMSYSYTYDLYFYFDNSNNIRYIGIRPVTIDGFGCFMLVNNTIDNTIFNSIMSYNTSAYQLGYEAGFNEGVSSVEHQNNGVFGLISDAFYSIADILNITFLPGFTLGTLISIPIVVMVIIVLFKMFRG